MVIQREGCPPLIYPIDKLDRIQVKDMKGTLCLRFRGNARLLPFLLIVPCQRGTSTIQPELVRWIARDLLSSDPNISHRIYPSASMLTLLKYCSLISLRVLSPLKMSQIS